MNILLTFTGFHDPYFKGLVDQEEQPGPILSLLTVHPFDQVILFDTPPTKKVTEETKKAIARLYPKLKIEVLDINLDDPTDYRAILKGLRQHIQTIQQGHIGDNSFISVASGTPQMHACWVLLTAAGEIPATILHVRPPKFVTKQCPLVSKIDLTAPDFPHVRFQIFEPHGTDKTQINMEVVAQQFGLVGDHSSMREALEKGALLASSPAPILLYGETGTGKELFSRFIHRLSGRTAKNFIPVNCAAIPESLVESLLFGHKKGSFTGALTDRPHRTLIDYKSALNLVLKHANSIMFIDAHLDPGRRQYRDFCSLLEEAGDRKPAPLIEIHRVCYQGSGRNRTILRPQEIEDTFRRTLSASLNRVGLNVEVFIWDDFHDRHLISNLVGIGLQNGFDTTTAPNALTTWTRLGRSDRDDIQREFDPASNRHSLRHRFKIP